MGLTGRARLARLALSNPVTTVVLGCVLVADSASLPWRGYDGRRSAAAYYVRRTVLDQMLPPPSIPVTHQLYFVREGNELTAIDPEVESWDELGRLLTERPADVLLASAMPFESRSGLWALTEERRGVRVAVTPMADGAAFPPGLLETARSRFLDWLERCGTVAPELIALARRDVVEERTLWRGYGHNALLAALLVLFVVSLAWVPRAPAWWRARRRARALSHGRCPGCGYSIAGLERGRCPECGTEWSTAEVAAARDDGRGMSA